MKQKIFIFAVVIAALQTSSFAANVVGSKETRASRHKKPAGGYDFDESVADGCIRRGRKRKDVQREKTPPDNTLPDEIDVESVGAAGYVADQESISIPQPKPDAIRSLFPPERRRVYPRKKIFPPDEFKSDSTSLKDAISKMCILCETRAQELQNKYHMAMVHGGGGFSILHRDSAVEAANAARRYRAAELAIVHGEDPHKAFDLYVLRGEAVSMPEVQEIGVDGDVGMGESAVMLVDDVDDMGRELPPLPEDDAYTDDDFLYADDDLRDNEENFKGVEQNLRFNLGFCDASLGFAPQASDQDYLAGYDRALK